MKPRLHLGNCSKCNSGLTINHKGADVIKADWVMCYRLPIRFTLGDEGFKEFFEDGAGVEIGKHLDLCLYCITQAFQNKKAKQD